MNFIFWYIGNCESMLLLLSGWEGEIRFMIDIHTHVLPGIDDGAANWDEALGLARAAAAEGITDLIATPHHGDGTYVNPAGAVTALVDEMNLKLVEEALPIKVHSGQEIHVRQDLLEQWQDSRSLLGLAGKRYALLEMPSSRIPTDMKEFVYELHLLGVRAVIAHPERNAEVVRHPERLEELVELGAYAQVTSHSLLGGFGRGIERSAWMLCGRGLIHFIASDAHHLDWRGFRLAEAYEKAAETLGREWADYYADNAKRLLRGQEIGLPPASDALKQKTGWRAIKSLFYPK
ncbi:tyrosine-protein phosphatase [Paenibacillus sp. NPDC058071]|uniref:tyrosine-protein phosphatase n=1 Tax=Paenibacillus sp. NPDC058071 TaxID=3346326 RepID=UPI0036DDEC88